MSDLQLRNYLPSLFFVYAGNIRFGMGLDPTRESKLLAYIERCKEQQDIVWFTDCNGVNHAAIEASQIKKTESLVKPADWTNNELEKLDDPSVEYHLYYQNGSVEAFESSYKDHPYVFSILTYALKTKKATPIYILGDYLRLIGVALAGYTSTAGISCFCPTNKLLLSGCPSSLGKHCVTKLATTPKRWK